MKMERPYDRGMASAAQFVRPSADDQLNLVRAPSESEWRVRTKKIFIVRKTTRLLSPPQRVSSWELIIVLAVTIAGLIGIFWPLL
jgi:hypothetical protein